MQNSCSHNRQESTRGDPIEWLERGRSLPAAEGYSFSSLSRIIIHLTQKDYENSLKKHQTTPSKNGMETTRVAALLKISIPAYSRLETGRTGVNIKRLRQIAELFKVSIVDMFSSDVTALKSEDTLKIEELSEKLHQRESLLVDLLMICCSIMRGKSQQSSPSGSIRLLP